MDIVDAQIHVWEEDRPERPWDPDWGETLHWMLEGEAVTAERAIAAMDAVGVDAAVVVAFPLYPDVDLAVEATTRHPDRFRTVTHIDLDGDDPVAELNRYADLPVVVAMRVAFAVARDGFERLGQGAFQPVFAAAQRRGLPVMLAISGNPLAADVVARANPELPLIVDHMGLAQPHGAQTLTGDPFSRLDDLLSLALYPNVAVKVSAMPTLSREAYPYVDLWPHLHRVLEAFGAERVMWGSDFSRTLPQHTYAEALCYVQETNELSDAEKELLLGGTVRRILSWPRRSG